MKNTNSSRSIIGPPGVNGSNGEVGPTGLPGPPGYNGTKGDIGPAGPAGPPGYNGTRGPAGPSGLSGVQGPRGPSGYNGTQGPPGPGASSCVFKTSSSIGMVASSMTIQEISATEPNVSWVKDRKSCFILKKTEKKTKQNKKNKKKISYWKLLYNILTPLRLDLLVQGVVQSRYALLSFRAFIFHFQP